MNAINKIVNFPFIIFQIIPIALRKYDKVISKCNKRSIKYGNNNYGSLYIKMHCFYYQKKYTESYDTFLQLLRLKYLNNKVKDWGVRLFIETEISNNHNFKLGLVRCNQLMPIILNELLYVRMQKIIQYINVNKSY